MIQKQYYSDTTNHRILYSYTSLEINIDFDESKIKVFHHIERRNAYDLGQRL